MFFSKVNLIVSERSSSDDYVSTAMLILEEDFMPGLKA